MSRLRPGGADPVWDAVVVGAGPAGSMTAYGLARGGASVLLLERQSLPRWKVCGACLSPGTLALLEDAGLGGLARDSGGVPLRTLRIGGWGREASVALGSSVALSRRVLDRALADAAVSAGATLVTSARARLGPVVDGARLVQVDTADGEEGVRARVVVAADGLTSHVLARAQGGTGARVASPSRIGFGGVFSAEGHGDYVPGVIHMAVGDGGYVGLVRQEDGRLDVAAALDVGDPHGAHPRRMVDAVLDSAGFPALRGEPETGWRGTPALTRTVGSRGAERVFAVGDAAGYVEPFTGEGIAWALSGARTLTPILLDAVGAWHPHLVRRWDAAWNASVGRSARLCRAVAWGLRRPRVSRAGLYLLRHLPGAASPVVRHLAKPPPYPAGSTP